MSFAENIRKCRLAAELTQEALGEKIGVSGQAVSKWENSETLPDTALLPDIADALDVSLDMLFDRETVRRESVCETVSRYISCADDSLGTSSEFYLFDTIASAFRSLLGEHPVPTYDSREDVHGGHDDPGTDKIAALARTSAHFSSDSGVGVVFESVDFPYAAVVFGGMKQNDFKAMIDDPDMQEFLFAVGDPDGFRCIRYLLTATECAVEGSLLFRKSGADPNRMDEVLGKLSKAGIVSVNSVNIN